MIQTLCSWNLELSSPYDRRNSYRWASVHEFYDKTVLSCLIISSKAWFEPLFCLVDNQAIVHEWIPIWTLIQSQEIEDDAIAIKLAASDNVMAEQIPRVHVDYSRGIHLLLEIEWQVRCDKNLAFCFSYHIPKFRLNRPRHLSNFKLDSALS